MVITYNAATILHHGNCIVIQLAHNNVFHELTKYIENDCHFVRQHLQRGTLQLFAVSFIDQTTNIFTKCIIICGGLGYLMYFHVILLFVSFFGTLNVSI